VLLKLTTDRHEASRGLFATAELLVIIGWIMECSLSSDMAQMSHFCQQWRLKPSASKTISSVFHLHNTSATCELSVYLDGQRLRHECHPTYLGVTLDHLSALESPQSDDALYKSTFTFTFRPYLNQVPPKQLAVYSTCIIPAPPVNCQFIWMASAFGMSATQPISG